MSSLSSSAQAGAVGFVPLGTQTIQTPEGPRIVEFVSPYDFLISDPNGKKACHFSITVYGKGTLVASHEEDLYKQTGVQTKRGDRCGLNDNITGQSPHDEIAKLVIKQNRENFLKLHETETDDVVEAPRNGTKLPGIRCPECGALIHGYDYPCPNCN